MIETTTVERTYRGAAATGVPQLTALPGVRRTAVDDRQVLETERYDTDDRRLAANRIALAVDRGDGAAHWTLTLPDGAGTEALRVPLPPDAPDPADVPAELDELIRGAHRDRPVRPAARARTVRTRIRLLAADDRLVAMLVHDHVTVATLGRSTDVESWTEATLVPADGGPDLIAELEIRLAESGLRPAPRAVVAELERLLRPVPEPRSRCRAGKPCSAGAVLVDYLATQVDRIAAEDLRVRRDEPDAVHQLRVAARRLRSALQAYGPLLERDRVVPLVDRLRALGRRLAPARDAEVLHERISGGLAALAPELRLGPVQARVTRHFARVEAQARAAVLAELDGDGFARLRTALDELVERPPLSARAARPARRELPRLAACSARRLKRAIGTATTPGAGSAAREDSVRDDAMHAARKAGKRLRYAVEVTRPVSGKDVRRFTRRLKNLQTALGDHQDTVVARSALRGLGAQAHAAGENGFSFGVLHGYDTATASRIEADLPQLWDTAWKRKHRTWLH